MRKVTAVVAVLPLMVSCTTALAANATTSDDIHQQHRGMTTGSMTQFPRNHMLDGIELTETQRQRMRDLMQQTRQEPASVSVNDLETLHQIMTADQFNEAAYRAELEKIARAEVARQLEFARVRHQMYQQLTPEQRAVSDRNHQQRMETLRTLNERQQVTSLQAVSSNQ
ncbi:stress adaptor protein CpxP [Erwinia sp. OLTSP20]|uniref:cell-envelope stress modulator CpxP n=1 Tax=unclassified Erwinia TaxID=2622719 RepID=UPI000C190DFC|nr:MULTISPECIES: cell-envelope stress modulator CpxP [unclassified Erwinia]PIJ49676.1 stress adaptor protein CpxP [Erwinia sp. OAMSP11]PIJ70091.1 stress adaptor protein CpxP [Erwinia sp. OLSSP12]PIJ80588.1 stress adaptor protein CpxP [Erwinia sp. OLCASP19]PIJ82753.1 stress adaptor protein CpxP [Erwinia sp. OLMTSP26]PIJ84830.1 stress adaptor protein CpxP [Erwinia sp. OLMDSP33]